MNDFPADDEAAPYLTQALFLATTMAAPASSVLLTAKRERVFKLMSQSMSKHANVEFAGIQLQHALLGISNWHDSLPTRHRLPEVVIDSAEGRIRNKFPTRKAATEALAELLRKHAPYADLQDTEAALKDAVAKSRSVVNRGRRKI
ncbi:hypothetical protein HMP09_1975 [Sphingomonas sp. HMP9]|uniref:hypothetical protein n=1 Tax=Sphingomonas sp. HMP9 TaxID=1517554 RepID=UPI001596679F|nr:hypothetical protein [Sphingomonas sp. HMP9]BCA62741.1 hypothetical protein HMP09_1975 [Sphingomonas sp. HMP9]